ncbi:MAG: hypothetical protein WD359_04470, partial [Dehalococcoidia bacterium]
MDLRVTSASFWIQAVAVAVGIWITVAPAVLDLDGAAPTNGHIAGPVVVSFATIALWECLRGVRLACVIIGLWLVLAPWLLRYDSASGIASDMASGLLLTVAVLLSGRTVARFGGGW